MAYATSISPERLYREKVVAVQALATDYATGTATAGAVTVNDLAGKITTNTSSAATDTAYVLTITVSGGPSTVAAGDFAFASATLSSGTAAGFAIMDVKTTANTVTISIINTTAGSWTNAVFVVSYWVVKQLGTGVAN